MLTASPATEPRQRVVRAGTLWYDQPAERWFSALPVGNGRLGGMVYGGVPAERIDLSESTVWSGGPSPSTADLSPTAREQVPNVRKLLFAGEYAQAQQLAAEHLLGTRASFGTNLPLPHLSLTFNHGPAANYRRALDLDEGLASVTYDVDGVRFTREVLASHPHGVIAVRLTADRPGAISFTAGLDGSVFPGRTGTGIAFSGRAVESLHSDGSTGALSRSAGTSRRAAVRRRSPTAGVRSSARTPPYCSLPSAPTGTAPIRCAGWTIC